MSTADATAASVCASCGEGKNKELKKCGACELVRYCGIECQRNHRPKHKKECKKRAAELKEELLFKQPESSHLGDCPICLLPIPLYTEQDSVRFTMYQCCSTLVCDGCAHANILREKEARLTASCPFCRQKLSTKKSEIDLQSMKRVKANDPLTLHD